THIINGTGNTLTTGVTTATANYLWLNPTFSASAALGATGTNVNITIPTESWHAYQLQYKNALMDPIWQSLGNLFGGDDTLETITNSVFPGSRFYRVLAW
ncbi:MAG TPA: hypothetical protein VNX46_16940, partial [Candidatus Acidoferrum sp.]|nr:hypothetical protein [Candidatus Acidoferrum sp.]